MSYVTTSFLYLGPVTTADQPHHRQGEAPYPPSARRTAGGGPTDAGSILPLAQGRASAVGAFLSPA